MFSEPNGHETARSIIIEMMEDAHKTAKRRMEQIEEADDRLAFIRNSYLPIIAGLADALGKIKP